MTQWYQWLPTQITIWRICWHELLNLLNYLFCNRYIFFISGQFGQIWESFFSFIFCFIYFLIFLCKWIYLFPQNQKNMKNVFLFFSVFYECEYFLVWIQLFLFLSLSSRIFIVGFCGFSEWDTGLFQMINKNNSI